MKKKKKTKKKIKRIIVLLLLLIIVIIAFFFVRSEYLKKEAIKRHEEHVKLVKDNYSELVTTTKESKLYTYDASIFKEAGTISKDYNLKLDGIKDDYYKITNFDNEYYIKYTDIAKTDATTIDNDRYKKYIPFNQNVKTTNKTTFYDKDNNMILELNKDVSLPLIVKDTNKYGVIFDKQLLYIKKEDSELVNNKNTNDVNTKGIAVLNYHFVYEDNDKSCREDICVSESFFRKHMDYIKNNNYFTPTMHELEDYVDGKIQLPKSVVITFDDGRYLNNAKRILEEYKLNGTFFVISGWNFNIDFKNYHSDYLELHSHTHNMHDLGQCPTGQGGGIQCFSEEKIQEDLKKSRETLFGTTYLAYPFYEYNNYSIEQLKKAGFTMAFGGEYENGQKYVKPGINKYKLPRWVMVNWTSNYDFTSYLTLK